ncbi:hypothetical protein [Emcibacter sp. SYSU 3D8]|uniref:hypothetical protein n=1 Tax=Emcibacter sp. SYSU 3D8 TaxID=3133969 RepID=UPI0031FF4226
MQRLWIVIAAVLLASCQSGGTSSGAASDKAREDAERDRKIDSVQEQLRNINH